jgi:hypothetical protein
MVGGLEGSSPEGPAMTDPRNGIADTSEGTYVFTGTLPTLDEVRALIADAYERFRAESGGNVTNYISGLDVRIRLRVSRQSYARHVSGGTVFLDGLNVMV